MSDRGTVLRWNTKTQDVERVRVRHVGRRRVIAISIALATILAVVCASAALAATTTLALKSGQSATVTCAGTKLTATKDSATKYDLACSGGTTTTTTRPPTTTTAAPTTTTTQASGGNCTNPTFTTSDAEGTDNTDPNDGEYYWVNNDAWNGSAGPQTLYVCNQSSWYAVSNQPNDGGAVETYPDTELDVGGREHPSTTPISGWGSITSTFSEAYPSAGGWDAAYDMWTDNYTNETMIWNAWAGSNGYWYTQATTSVTLGGVAYKFLDNNGELIFFRVNQVSSGSVDILAAYQWEVANGYASASDVLTQIEYGVEVSYTNGVETFPMNGLTFSLVSS